MRHPPPAAVPQELFYRLRGEILRGEVLAAKPAAEIGQQMHMVAYRIEGITLTNEFAPQTVRKRRKRPVHHNPPRTLPAITRVHDHLLCVVEDSTNTREEPQIMTLDDQE